MSGVNWHEFVAEGQTPMHALTQLKTRLESRRGYVDSEVRAHVGALELSEELDLLTAAPAPIELLQAAFGTVAPTRDQIDDGIAGVCDAIARGEAVYFPYYDAEGKRAGWCFAGASETEVWRTGPNRKPRVRPVLYRPRGPLTVVLGEKPAPRLELVRRFWAYVKTENLQDARTLDLTLNAPLKALFGTRRARLPSKDTVLTVSQALTKYLEALAPLRALPTAASAEQEPEQTPPRGELRLVR